jgi:hypothetical protein
MSLSLLHTASGLILLMSFLLRIGIHAYIDFRHGRLDGLLAEVLFFSKYLKPYRTEVQPAYKVLKYACNLLLRFVVLSLLINATLGILILY